MTETRKSSIRLKLLFDYCIFLFYSTCVTHESSIDKCLTLSLVNDYSHWRYLLFVFTAGKYVLQHIQQCQRYLLIILVCTIFTM